MRTPREKYENDMVYKQLVDMLENAIVSANLTPSEVREASILACIHYESRRIITYMLDTKTADALGILSEFTTTQSKI